MHIEDIRSRSQRYAWEIAAHTHRGLHQCLVLLSGGARVRVDEHDTELAAPALVLLPPGTVHAFRFREHTHGYVLTFAADTLLDGETGRTARNAPRTLRAAATAGAGTGRRLRRAHRRPARAAARRVPPARGRAGAGVRLARLQRAVDPRPRAGATPRGRARTRRQHRWFTEFRALLEAHYLEHWPVARYARALGLTEGRLNRLCEKQSGRSAFALAQERLALEARRRLIYIALPVAELARELGFRDPAYFSRFFRRHAGVPPDRFRRQHGAG
ncbi:MAG: helix-turn-helix domain-containing protein [Steroidobacteraceae bacterium]